MVITGQSAPEYPTFEVKEKEYPPVKEKEYPAYCTYISTGMDKKIEKQTVDMLGKWGDKMGDNLFVAPWKIGDTSYKHLLDETGFKHKPVIILTDTDINNEIVGKVPKLEHSKILL